MILTLKTYLNFADFFLTARTVLFDVTSLQPLTNVSDKANGYCTHMCHWQYTLR